MAGTVAALQSLLAATFAVAAVAKWLRPAELPQALEATGASARLSRPLAMTITSLEVGVAFALVFSSKDALAAAAVVAGALLVLFTVWAVVVLLRGVRLHCACFGSRGGELGRLTIARNVVLLGGAAATAVLAPRTESLLPAVSGWEVMTVASCALTLALTVALWHTLPSLVLTRSSADAARSEA
jgi:hypothetical protein